VTNVWTLLQDRARAQPGTPVVTFADVRTGSRTELSAASLQNAAAKIANALRDSFDLEPGSRVGVQIPQHWQRSAWCAGVWTAGCVLVLDDAAPVDLIVAGPSEAVSAGAAPVAVVSLHPLGLPLAETLPAGVEDVTLAVRQQPDAYLYDPPTADLAALLSDGHVLTQSEVLAAARDRAERWGLVAGGRLLAAEGLDAGDAWMAALAVPLSVEGSVVLVAGDGDLDAVSAQERVTAFASPS
jgi:uncharacterized protein (TIGR03089 family)